MSENIGIASDTGPFCVNERVLIPFTDKNYEAKILKAEFRQAEGDSPAGWFYFVHYNGWNKKYDTWVEDAGLIKMPQGSELVGVVAPPAVGLVGAAVTVQCAAAAPKTKRVTMKDKFLKSTAGVSLNPSEGAVVMLELDIPAVLKRALLDDYDAIVEEGRLQPLPRRPTVAVLLQRYAADAQQYRGSCEPEEELALGLRTYFDKSFFVALLYKSEREQAAQAVSDGRVASCVYGAEHLVRLFVKLPELLAVSVVTELQVSSISVMVQDLMMWMVDNAESLFMAKDDYIDGFIAAAVAEPDEDEAEEPVASVKPERGVAEPNTTEKSTAAVPIAASQSLAAAPSAAEKPVIELDARPIAVASADVASSVRLTSTDNATDDVIAAPVPKQDADGAMLKSDPEVASTDDVEMQDAAAVPVTWDLSAGGEGTALTALAEQPDAASKPMEE